VQAERGELAQQVDTLETENASLQEELEAARAARDEARTQLETVQGERQDLSEQLENSQAETASLQEELSAAQEAGEGLQNQLEAVQGEQQGLNEQLQSVQAEREELTQQLETVQGERQELSGQLESSQAENASLQEELSAARSAQEEAQAQNESLQEELGAVQRQLEQSGAEQAELSAQLEGVTGERDTLAEQLGSAEGLSAEELLAPSEEQLAGAQTRAARLTEELRDFLVVSPSVSTLSGAQREQYDTLRADLRAAQNTVARLSGSQDTYIVRSGDSLSRLAQSYYGSGARWPEILDANTFLNDPDELFTGLVLVIP
jgi:chromosome segregation ATPase